jgi:transposase
MGQGSGRIVAGLDVHKCSTRIAAVQGDRLVGEVTVSSDPQIVEGALRRLGVVACCYEAGPTGYGLYRWLNERGLVCEVIAPGLVWRQPGDRIKTDPRDARRLAAQYAGGMLRPIHVLSPEQEALRDLVRAREDARHDRMRARGRLGKFLLRQGRSMPTQSWSLQRRTWLGQQAFAEPAAQAAFDDYLMISSTGASTRSSAGWPSRLCWARTRSWWRGCAVCGVSTRSALSAWRPRSATSSASRAPRRS